MKHGVRFAVVLLLVAIAVMAVTAQPVRKDAIWARTAPAGSIVLDGKLNELVWTKAESLVVRFGQNAGDPGSGWRQEGDLPTANNPSDPTNAVVKYLVAGNKLYMGVTAKDSSIGGGTWARFDAILLNMRDKGNLDPNTKIAKAFEYFYG